MWFAASSINAAAALRLVVTGVTVMFRPRGSGYRARIDLFVLESESPLAHYVTGLVFLISFMYLVYCEAFLLVYVSVSNYGMKRAGSGGLSASVGSYDTISSSSSSNSIPLTMSHLSMDYF